MDSKLPKYTLSYDKEKKEWKLNNDKTNRVVNRFETKESAVTRGILRKAVRGKGGSVKINTLRNEYQEERTYPKSKDPTKSIG